MFAMNSSQKKVFRGFRIAPELEAELRRRSQLTRINQTAIVEEALRTHFAKTMVEQLTKAVKKIVRGHGHSRNACSMIYGISAAA